MSYCVNPSCTQPKNSAKTTVCQTCGSKLRLRDHYRVLGILGKGGFGTTFAALDLSLPSQSVCVVKQLRPSTDDPSVYKMAKQLFEREAQTLGRIGNHPQIPRLLDYFEEHQEFYLVQEYIKGYNLHQEVKRNGPFSEAGVRQFLSELLPILQYIHAQQVIHRDIKPANLIRRHEDRKLVLIDFGAVKNQVNSVVANTSAHTTFTAFAVGTVGFAPPEQMAMRPVYASDIYAIGVTCIYLITGKSPKNLESDPSTGEILWEKSVSVSESFANVLKTMLELSVRQRYKSADEVLKALDLVSYAESLAKSLITPPVATNSIPVDTSNHSPVSQVPATTSQPPLGDRSRQSPPNPSTAESSSTPNGMGFQFAIGHTSSRNGTRNTEQSLLKKIPKLDARALLEAYERGKRDFAQQELNNLNLQKANLPGISFHQSKLAKVNLQGADLSNADFGQANLSQAILKNANLSRAYLSYADLGGADLRGADLSFAHLKYANLKDTNLCGANLANAQVAEEQLAHAKTNWMTTMPSGKRGFW